ncbi:3-carboxymuconate cyclase protein [Lasiodiplodia theobromae]|uniref:3-carboxymuconate cyclase protein n=1 Tax=Lasiodiplodia theobromae TaxID=45133 RepID=UPI0015C3FDC2|nr:3-carboxymuconate cyclase protein [Lasiodiplodia theobromae]KAF4546157.1 3-carboxymuconate cyclase protein [Lasiodiplodia theobromae]
MPTQSSLLLSSLWLFTLAASAPAPHCGAECQVAARSPTVGKAVYFLTNDAQNAVVALPIAADGTLSDGTVTATNGAGSNAIDGTTNKTSAPDALVGQSSLTIAGNSLFAVNAGSDTLTMLSISPSNPTHLTALGHHPMPLPGEFPNTVAASPKHRLACVGTTGAKAGISCAPFHPSHGFVGAMDALRPFDDTLGQTTPPVGPTNTVSHAFFSADEGRLFVTVKGDPAANKTGFVSVFDVEQQQQQQQQRRWWSRGAGGKRARAKLASCDTRSSPAGTAVLFGAALVPGSKDKVFVTDAAFGAAVLSVSGDNNNRAELLAKQAVDGQMATCWATVSEATGTAFVTDVGVNRVVEMSVEDASVVGVVDLAAQNGDPGLIDLKAAGDFVYALSPGNGSSPAAVTVLDVSGGRGKARMIQHFELTGMGVGRNAQGMAVMM